MPRPVLLALLLASAAPAALGAAPTDRSSHHESHLRVDDSSLTWDSDGRRLALRDAADGVRVVEANTLRLQPGDVVTRVGETPVHDVRQWLAALRARPGLSVALQVRGGDGRTRVVQLSGGEIADLAPPPPPPSLPPPPPPAPAPIR